MAVEEKLGEKGEPIEIVKSDYSKVLKKFKSKKTRGYDFFYKSR